MKKEVKIPEISESVDMGQVANILVKEGDKVSKDQSLIEIETEKAATDIPSPYAGIVDEIKIKVGDEVKKKQVFMIIEVDEDAGDVSDERKQEEKEKEEEEEGDKKESPRKDIPSGDEEKEQHSQTSQGEDKTQQLSDIPASPSVRRLAREKNIDIRDVEGTGPGNRITAEDIEKFTKAGQKAGTKTKTQELPDFSRWGDISRESMDNVRKITANNLQENWSFIPHVTQHDEADITKLEEFRKQNLKKVEKEGGKLTITSILLKIAGFALEKFPSFNASIDMKNQEIIFKHFYHIGIAVDTPRGLLVPVIREINKKSLSQIAVELTEIAEKARNKKIKPEEMEGGNFTISNLGGIGGTSFTPIVYAPQVAILGLAEAATKPVWNGEQFTPRLMLPMSLSYDHRIIDGADGARFLRFIVNTIENPFQMII